MAMFQRSKNPAQLAEQLEKLNSKQSFNENDGKVFNVTLDSSGNGSAVIRFLPSKSENELPFVQIINHGFTLGKGWYIENCTSTKGDFDSCPVCQYLRDNDCYNTDKKMYANLKRATSYWSNILVISDPANPENNGKVFKYRFGGKIMDKIKLQAKGDPELGEDPVDVSCVFDGANFVVKIKKVGEHNNYDDCKFQAPKPIANIEDEAYQAKLFEEMYDIQSIVADSEFKTYEENKKSFDKVMGTSALGGSASAAASQADKLSEELDNFNAQMEDFNIDEVVDPVVEDKPKQVEKTASASSSDKLVDELLGDLDL